MNHQINLMLVAGARPNFMKIAPVIREIQKRSEAFRYTLVHTGQHYDEGMSDVFFRDLGIPTPDYHLNIGSGSHASQTAAIMVAFEPIIIKESPDCLLVFGDVNSTLACSIVSKKLGFKVAHVEAGLRSGDLAMPEEINRIVTDAISDYFFVTEESGLEHLRQEGKPENKLFHVGHVMIDNLFYEVANLDREKSTTSPSLWRQHFANQKFGVVTLHRPSNVDDQGALTGIIGALEQIALRIPLLFPVHPRTHARMKDFGISPSERIHLTGPLGYREFLDSWRHAAIVLTDSGGLQEETTALGVPCLTLRNNTERPVTITQGTNRLVGNEPAVIVREAFDVLGGTGGPNSTGRRPSLWDGHASGRILDALENELTPS